MGKPVSDWIDYAYVNIPIILGKCDNLTQEKYAQDSMNVELYNSFDFPYILQVVKDVYCRNTLEKLKLSSLAKTYTKRIAIADGKKTCRYCGKSLPASSSSSFTSTKDHCCDQYHRLFRLAVNYAELLHKHYRQQRYKKYRSHRQKLISSKDDSPTGQFDESIENVDVSVSESTDRPASRLSTDSKGEVLENIDRSDKSTPDEKREGKDSSNLVTDTIENASKEGEESESSRDTIIYQLSNRKYIEQGWTVSHTNKYNTHDNDDDDDNGDLTGNQQGESIQLNGYSPELQEVTSTNLSSLNLDYIQQEYSNGEVFIRKYNDGSGVIFYPTGNPAILFLPLGLNNNNNTATATNNTTNKRGSSSSNSCGVLFVVHDQLRIDMVNLKEKTNPTVKQKRNTSNNNNSNNNNNKTDVSNNNSKIKKSSNLRIQSTVGQLIGVFDTSIHGVVYDRNNNNIRLEYNPTDGVYFCENGKLRKWQWSGEVHTHAPPFQPLILKLNKCITLKIYQSNKIYLHFNVMKIDCRLDLTSEELKLRWINMKQCDKR
nr:unnamed protein product [Trichobilharzia regenti]